MLDKMRCRTGMAVVIALSFIHSASADTIEVTSSGVGINKASPAYALDVVGEFNVTTNSATTRVKGNEVLFNNSSYGYIRNTNSGTNAGLRFTIGSSNTDYMLLVTNGIYLGSGINFYTNLIDCRDAGEAVGTDNAGKLICNTGLSSERYKKHVRNYMPGLSVVEKLRPVSFEWRSSEYGNGEEIGFLAEEIQKVEPLLATYNDDGSVRGVRYDRLVTVLANAVKEQQSMIQDQRKEISQLNQELEKMADTLKKVNHLEEQVQELISLQRVSLKGMTTSG